MSIREQLHKAIEEANDTQEDEVKGAVLKSWVVVASWVGTDGNPWLTHSHDELSPAWERIGMLQTVSDMYRNIVATGDEDE